jgi:ADP-ribose pyrophosphatase YjhB (NUDIX family)
MMTNPKEPTAPLWLLWAREIQAIGQTGLHFSQNEFDRQRYQRLEEIASQVMARYTEVTEEALRDDFAMQTGYATPKVDVRAAVFRDGQILLVQEASDGCWSLPGGWADVNERPSAMVEREVWEESGFHVRARKVVGLYESNHDRLPLTVYHAYKVVFLCDLVGGEARGSNETLDVGFFSLENLPPFSPSRTKLRFVQEAFAHMADPDRLAAFD